MNPHSPNPPAAPDAPTIHGEGPPDGNVSAAQPSFAEVAISGRRMPSIVWLIPFVAILIGGWLTYQTITEKGPTITLTLKNADGLEAGKTRVKYKSVDVGLVEAIEISDDLQHVIVTAVLDKDATPHLTDGTRFWVVRPQFSLTRVSGLDTLISGAYIAVEPGEGAPRRAFTGLDVPPVVRRNVPGNKYVLTAGELGSVGPGSPIYYRQMRVGEVLGYELTDDDQTIELHVFVESPHHRLVRDGTRFYSVSGIDVAMGADGMTVRTASLAAIIAGGIAFDTPDHAAPGAPDGTVFALHPNRKAADAPVFTEQLPYVLYFEDSVRGLQVGAPVEFRGIRVGEVTDVRLEFDTANSALRIPVTIAIEPGRVPDIDGNRQSTIEEARAAIQALVDQGMRAQLETGNLISGARLIALDLHPDAPLRLADVGSPHTQLPTIDSNLSALSHSASRVLAKLGDLPLDQLVTELTSTMQGINALVRGPQVPAAIESANQTLASFGRLARNVNSQVKPLATSVGETSDAANATLRQMRESLGAFAQGAPMRIETLQMLEEGAAAARSIRILADYLERHPEALISGKGG
ncbi:MAG: MlaD family protein [Gammaproteobacteria bacterium]|nr:MlaD family protein [Gammaproteobacteria bacterium]